MGDWVDGITKAYEGVRTVFGDGLQAAREIRAFKSEKATKTGAAKAADPPAPQAGFGLPVWALPVGALIIIGGVFFMLTRPRFIIRTAKKAA